jgi:hypothetical protein
MEWRQNRSLAGSGVPHPTPNVIAPDRLNQEVLVTTQIQQPQATQASYDGLGTASLALGVLGFFPIPGVFASLLAIVLGVAVHMSSTPASVASKQRATAGIALGATSLLLFIAFCVMYFGVLGYPLPHIAPYRPEPHY